MTLIGKKYIDARIDYLELKIIKKRHEEICVCDSLGKVCC